MGMSTRFPSIPKHDGCAKRNELTNTPAGAPDRSRAMQRILLVGTPGASFIRPPTHRALCRRRPRRHLTATAAPIPSPTRPSPSRAATGTPLLAPDGTPLLHVVFVHPRIHWNTGNIGRTCLGLGAALHLVGPLGFSLGEKEIRRAGLDYWEHVDLRVHADWDSFASGPMREIDATRFFFTKFGTESATGLCWPDEGKTMLVFGSETDGFDGIRGWLEGPGKGERTVSFPMVDERVRCFNLSTTASMVSGVCAFFGRFAYCEN